MVIVLVSIFGVALATGATEASGATGDTGDTGATGAGSNGEAKGTAKLSRIEANKPSRSLERLFKGFLKVLS